jgi:[acyl-carrier-protein] S-malonyltransferase
MDLQGEFLGAIERVVVSPSAGIFTPVADPPSTLEAGTTLGFIEASGTSTPVCSPFGGELISIVAADGERLTTHQRVAWLRAA